MEYVGKETLDILASETGFDLETDEKSPEEETTGKVESYTEDVTFDHCFYIYGGPEHLGVGSSKYNLHYWFLFSHYYSYHCYYFKIEKKISTY